MARSYARNVTLYAVLEVVSASSFVMGNWIFFWLRVMTYGQLGVVDALAFAFGMIMEVPTGAIGDLVGKRRTLQLAMAFNALGWWVMGFSDSVEVLLIGFLLAQIGFAFYSGSGEALLYDSLKADRLESQYDRIYSRVGMITLVTLVLSTLVGGVMYTLDERLPHLAWGAMFALGSVVSFWLIEPPNNAPPFSIKGYFQQLRAGFQQLLTPALKSAILPVILLRGAGYMYSMGLIQPTMAIGFGFMADAQSVVISVLILGAMVATGLAPRFRRYFGDRRGLMLAGVLMGFGYASAFFPLAMWGFFGMLAIRSSNALIGVLTSTWLNERIPSETRATTLSTVALFVRIPYILTAILAGTTAEGGAFGAFSLAIGLGVMASALLGFRPIREVPPQ